MRDVLQKAEQMSEMTLPNGMRVWQLEQGATAYLYRDVFTDAGWIKHGIDLRAGEAVIDIGAHIGLASLYFSTIQPACRVIACEPADAPFEALERNLRRHLPEACALHVAIGSAKGRSALTYYPQNTIMSSLYADPAADRAITMQYLANIGLPAAAAEGLVGSRFQSRQIECDVQTLSDIIERCGAEDVGLVKVDAERAELDVLLGLQERHWSCIRQFAIEAHDLPDGRLSRLVRGLVSHGFRTYAEQDSDLQGTELVKVFARR